MLRRALVTVVVGIWCVCGPLIGRAVGQTTTARVFVTVTDPSGGGLPGAMVTLVGLEDATKKAPVPPVAANEKGLATFERVVPGRYSLQAEFSGFDLGLLRNVTLKRGDNRHVIVLAVKAITEHVDVGGGQELASSRSASSFGLSLSKEDIETLSDDPTELQRQIEELAGPDAVIRVDSFEGAQLPPKSQIKSVHITRDQFAAEAQTPGSTFVDIITQPGAGPLSGNTSLSYRPTALAGRSPFVTRKNPDVSRNFGGSIGGTLVKEKSDFSLSVYGQNMYTTPIVNQGDRRPRCWTCGSGTTTCR